GSTRNSVSKRYSGPSRVRAAAAVTSFTFDAGFIRASASLLKTTLPSSRLTSWTPRRASRKGDRWARSRSVFLRASRSAARSRAGAGAASREAPARSAARRGSRRGNKRAALRTHTANARIIPCPPAGLQGGPSPHASPLSALGRARRDAALEWTDRDGSVG